MRFYIGLDIHQNPIYATWLEPLKCGCRLALDDGGRLQVSKSCDVARLLGRSRKYLKRRIHWGLDNNMRLLDRENEETRHA